MASSVESGKWLLILQDYLFVMSFLKYLPAAALCHDASRDRLSCAFPAALLTQGSINILANENLGNPVGFDLCYVTAFYLSILRPEGGHCHCSSGFKMKPREVWVSAQSRACPTKVPVCCPGEGSDV